MTVTRSKPEKAAPFKSALTMAQLAPPQPIIYQDLDEMRDTVKRELASVKKKKIEL